MIKTHRQTSEITLYIIVNFHMEKFEIDVKIYNKYRDIVDKNVFSKLDKDIIISDDFKVSILRVLYKRFIFLCDETVMELQDIEIGDINFFYKINKDLVSEDEKKEGAINLHKKLDAKGIDLLYERNDKLENLLLHATDKFSTFICDFLRRIYKDKDVIKKTFFGNEKLDKDFQVVDIQSDFADLHNDNKSTLIVTTNLGKLIYKPHDMKLDVFSYDFFDRFFKKWVVVPKALSYDSYGYSEYIESNDNDILDETIYYNVGALAAIFVSLGSTDYHAENILRKGQKPAIVDLETIFTPKTDFHKKVDLGFEDDLGNSIYTSGLLPCKVNDYQLSPLFNKEDKNKLALTQDGKRISINDFYRSKGYSYKEFFEGFDEAYFYILDNKKNIVECLNHIDRLNNRILIRNTDFYATLLKYTTKSYVAKLDDSYNILLKVLRKEQDIVKSFDYSRIYKYEASAIVNGDIPYFYNDNASESLYDGYGNIVKENYFLRNGIENAIYRLNNMSKDDNNFEKSIIKFSFENTVEEKNVDLVKRQCVNEERSEDIKKSLEEDVVYIYNSLIDNAIKSSRGYFDYLSLRENDFSNAKADCFLGMGYTGVLLFLSAADKYFAGKDKIDLKSCAHIYEDLVKETTLIIDSFADSNNDVISFMPTGLIDGIGSLYKALCLIYDLNNDERINNLCIKIIDLLNDKYYPLDNVLLDMYSGVSGLLYALLSCDRLKEHINKDLIARLSNHIISKKTLKYKDTYLWDTLDKSWPISGYAHGIAGISVALNYVYNYLKDEKIKDAVVDAIMYEYNVYDDKIKSWPDLRVKEASENYMHGICSGAPSVGISMVSYIKNTKNFDNDKLKPFVNKNLDRAIAKCMEENKFARDILCCGNCSSVEFMLEASDILKNDAIDKFLYRQLMLIHGNRIKNYRYQLMTPKYNNIFWISFLYGYSGIGYELLRFLDKKMIRSVFT